MLKRRYHFFGFTEADLKHGTLIFLYDNELRRNRENLLRQLGIWGKAWVDNGPANFVAQVTILFAPSVDTVTVSSHIEQARADSDDSKFQSVARLKEIADIFAADGSSVAAGCGAICQSVADRVCDMLRVSRSTSGACSLPCTTLPHSRDSQCLKSAWTG